MPDRLDVPDISQITKGSSAEQLSNPKIVLWFKQDTVNLGLSAFPLNNTIPTRV